MINSDIFDLMSDIKVNNTIIDIKTTFENKIIDLVGINKITSHIFFYKIDEYVFEDNFSDKGFDSISEFYFYLQKFIADRRNTIIVNDEYIQISGWCVSAFHSCHINIKLIKNI